jgi:GntR family transcriptional regulator
MRAYREMEIRGILDTQQGTGTFVAQQTIDRDALEHSRGLEQLVEEFAARAGAGGFKLDELMTALNDRVVEGKQPRTLKPKGDKR